MIRNTGIVGAMASKAVIGAWRSTGMWLRTGGACEVSALDRRTALGVDLLEERGLAAAVAQHGPPLGGADVADPVDGFAEHGHQVSLVVEVGDDHQEEDEAPGPATSDLQCGESRWP